MKRGTAARRAFGAGLAAACLVMAGAGLARAGTAPTFVSIAKPAEGARVLVVKPEATLNMLTAGGAQEPKDAWSQSAQKYLDASLDSAVRARKLTPLDADPDAYDDPRAVQMLKLNDAVTQSIALNALPYAKLPTKTGFDWTLGEDVAALLPAASTDGAQTAPAYALFVKAAGSYSSGGRAAVMVGMAMLGVGMPMGGQYMQGTLVDLKTGQVVWYQTLIVPSGTDIRTAEGAGAAVDKLLAKLPL